MFDRPGLWYEAPRRRWRVRLYHDGRIRHLSYHSNYDEAVRVHQRALSCPVYDSEPVQCHKTDTKSLIHRLRQQQE